MKKMDKVIIWCGSVFILIFILIQKILESKNINLRGNYYTLFISITILPILIFLFWLVPKLIKGYFNKKGLAMVARGLFGVLTVTFIGFMANEFATLREDIVVIDGISYVSNVRPQNIKYHVEGIYYEIIDDYFVKEPFSFTETIESN